MAELSEEAMIALQEDESWNSESSGSVSWLFTRWSRYSVRAVVSGTRLSGVGGTEARVTRT